MPAEMRQITRREDLQELHAITKSLIGQECWQAILTYPSQLQLHWGERVAYESERLRGEYRGTWVFGAESSRWTLQCRDKAMVSSDDYDSTIKRTIRILAGGATSVKVVYENTAPSLVQERACDQGRLSPPPVLSSVTKIRPCTAPSPSCSKQHGESSPSQDPTE